MSTRNALVALGVAISTFLVVAVVVTELASSTIEFSVFLGLPAGILAGLIAAVATWRLLQASPSDRARRTTAAIAGFGYAVILLAAVRYVVAPTRAVLSLIVIAGLAFVAALAIYVGPLSNSMNT